MSYGCLCDLHKNRINPSIDIKIFEQTAELMQFMHVRLRTNQIYFPIGI